MKKTSLNGKWTLSGGKYQDLKAKVPGCVHTDLLNNDIIQDPNFRDRETEYMWIGQTDWTYRRSFSLTEETLKKEHIELCCDGLDTLAKVIINGKTVLEGDNMFCTHQVDVKPFVEKENIIEVVFDSTYPYIKEQEEKRRLIAIGENGMRIQASNQIRKMQCNYGWDWGPKFVTAGIWRDIQLVSYDTNRIKETLITQKHQDGKVAIDMGITLTQKNCEDCDLQIEMVLDDQVIHQTTRSLMAAQVLIDWVVEKPKLWWPNQMGEQPLYDIHVRLVQKDELLDQQTKTIGLRTLELVEQPDEYGHSFFFQVNGVPFFAKGANWIPNHTFVSEINEQDYEKRIKDAQKANMNMLRVWGGGIYEADAFYRYCDQYGICVWQDFMFACSAYPTYDQSYLDSVKKEAVDNVKRIQHHACLALFCGNNEIEQIQEDLIGDQEGQMTQSEYALLFDQLLPEVVKTYAPTTSYIPSSPYSPNDREDFNSPNEGDAHLWDVWHGRKPFEWYRTCTHRFNSEFGFQSFPKPEIVRGFTLPKDRNISSKIVEFHQRSPIGNDAIMQYMLSWFLMPKDFEMTCWLSQILQGMAMKYAVEHWRRSMPRGMGTLYWQLNDCWPGPSWSGIDYKGNWKALHYMAKDFYAPIMITGVEDAKTQSIDLFLTNDSLDEIKGDVQWILMNTKGEILDQQILENVQVTKQSTQKVTTLQQTFLENTFVWMAWKNDDQILSENMVLFQRPKHMEWEEPEITIDLCELEPGEYECTLQTDVPAFWTWLDVEGAMVGFSDNFLHLLPGHTKVLRIHTKELDLTQLIQELNVYCLYDTHTHPEG